MTPPIWLLDIDGVINALDDPPDLRMWPDWLHTKAKSNRDIVWPILAALPVLDFLRQVHEQGRAEIRWHSTWQHHSVNVGAALGLPLWPVQECPEFRLDRAAIAVPLTTKVSKWWKLPAVQRLLTAGHRVLWTDDDIRYQLRRADIAALGENMLTVAPVTGKGLTRKHLERIDAWLA